MRDRAMGRVFGFLGRTLTGLAIVSVAAGGVLIAVHGQRATASTPSDDDSANAMSGVSVGKSGLPVPRFVSLKAGRVNVRVGPGDDYKVAWVFTKQALPVEVIAEFDTWRRVRDSDGQVGWVFHSLLSSKRTAVVSPWQKGDAIPIHSGATSEAAVTAYLQPGVLANVEHCRDGWCSLSGKGYAGWIEEGRLWGVYPGETVD
jgi:SH3-like domain-containing protein